MSSCCSPAKSRFNFQKLSTIVILCFFALVFLRGCTYVNKKAVYDDSVKIARAGDTYTYGSRIGGVTTEKLDITYTGFMGMETIWSIEVVNEGDIVLQYDSRVDKGRFKGVLIAENGDVSEVFEGAGKGESILKTGKYRFKIVGDSASGHIVIDVIAAQGGGSEVRKHYSN